MNRTPTSHTVSVAPCTTWRVGPMRTWHTPPSWRPRCQQLQPLRWCLRCVWPPSLSLRCTTFTPPPLPPACGLQEPVGRYLTALEAAGFDPVHPSLHSKNFLPLWGKLFLHTVRGTFMPAMPTASEPTK